jgi:hypothetical protein
MQKTTISNYFLSLAVALLTVAILNWVIHFPFNIYEAYLGCVIGVSGIMGIKKMGWENEKGEKR